MDSLALPAFFTLGLFLYLTRGFGHFRPGEWYRPWLFPDLSRGENLDLFVFAWAGLCAGPVALLYFAAIAGTVPFALATGFISFLVLLAWKLASPY